ncbi:unnamed protein product, partial [Prorocentrum cordatum]
MRKRRTYTVCSGCSGWVFDWELQRSGGWCNKCDNYITGWRFRQGKEKVDLGPLIAKDQKPSEVPKSQALRQAISKLDQKKAALGKAASQLMEAERWLKLAQEKHDKALEEAADAEEEHEQTLRAYSNSAIPAAGRSQRQAAAEDEAATWKAPAVDPDLFANLEDYEAEDKEKLFRFKSDMEALASLLKKAKKQYTGFTEAKKQADAIHASHKAKKRKEIQQRKERLDRLRSDAKTKAGGKIECGPKTHKYINEEGTDMYIIMMCETHIPHDKLKQVKVDVAKNGWKMTGTAAVPTKRLELGNLGGEIILAKSHIACSTYDTIRERLQVEGKKDPFYGFAAVNLHTKAGNVVLISAYWRPGAGMHGVNQERVRSLAGFVKAMADPWVILADWNVPFEDITKTGFVQQIGGALIKPDVEVTCDKGKGSLIDYGITRTDYVDKVKLQAVRKAFQEQTTIEEEAERQKEKPYYITDEIWTQTLASGIRDCELSDELKSWDGDLIIRGQRHWSAEAATTRMCAEWVTCLEESAIITDEIAEEEADLYRGRAGGFEVKWVKARSTPGRTHLKFGPAEHWGILNAILVRYHALHTNGTDGRQRAKCLADAKTQSRALQDMDQSLEFGKKYGEASQQMFYEMLGDLADLDDGQIKNL